MHLLVVVVEDEEDLDEVLTVLVEHKLLDSVVVEARTGLELLERDLPIFAGLRALVSGGIDFCRLILCPVPAEQGGQILDDLQGIRQKAATPSGFALLLEPGRLIRL